jgi:hypothetical protein
MTKTDLIHRWFDDLWNRGIESTIDEMMSPTIVTHGFADASVTGTEQFRAFYKSFREGLASINAEVLQVWESGDTVIARVRVKAAKNKGDEPTTIEGVTITRVENGQFVEGWNHFDFLGLLTGMGLVPRDAMANALAPT